VKPSVVERVTNEKGETIQAPQPEEVRRVISEDTAKKVALLLKATTEKGGTGEGAVPAGYEVAGKTGTAQKVDTRLGGYAEDRFTSGFMGFGPVDHPKLALLVVIDEPQGVNYGGVVAAPVFRSIMEKILPLLSAFPKGTAIVKDTTEESSGEERQARVSIEAVKIRQEAGKDVMPDLTGLPKRAALSRIEGKGLIIKVSGIGNLIEQVPRAGTVIERGDFCYLKFEI